MKILAMRSFYCIISILLCASNASAGPAIGWIYVATNGNDSTCNRQLSSDGSDVAPPIAAGTIPCKTLTHACAMLGDNGANWFIQYEPGTYLESAVCAASGSSAANRMNIIGVSAGHGPSYLTSPSSKPAVEITGHDVFMNKMDFKGSPQDGLYVHGTGAFSMSEDIVVGYNTIFEANGRHAIYANYTYWLLVLQSNIALSGSNCMEIDNSYFWFVYDSTINRCGSTTGTPTSPKPGLIAHNTQYGQYYANRAQYGASPNLELDDAYFTLVASNANIPPAAPFTFTINAANAGSAQIAYERATDIIIGN